jgi:hypothetical protein
MAKTLSFEYDGKEYVLQYTRKTIEAMERQGFVVTEIADKPMTCLPTLFRGAFLANHRYVKQDVIDDIFAHMSDKGELLNKLAEMYNEPIEALMGEPEDAGKNIKWGASF